MKISAFKIQSLIIVFSMVQFGFLAACNQPVLESPECISSRDSVKRFYSFHLGNDMAPSAESLEKRKKFLSAKLRESLKPESETKTDYFTQTDNYPKAFRAGKCSGSSKDRASFEVLLFWRTDEKNTQREITVEAVKENDSWLIDKVSSEK